MIQIMEPPVALVRRIGLIEVSISMTLSFSVDRIEREGVCEVGSPYLGGWLMKV